MKASIGRRITISKKDGEIIIKISGTIESWMNYAILGWLLLWTVIGMYVIYYLLAGKAVGEQFYFFVTYLAFWIYFEIKVLYSWMFRVFGFELIKITPKFLFIKRSLFGYGKVSRIDCSNIKNIDKVKDSRGLLNLASNHAFWVVGNDQIQLEALGKQYGFGMHLIEHDTRELLVWVRKFLKSK